MFPYSISNSYSASFCAADSASDGPGASASVAGSMQRTVPTKRNRPTKLQRKEQTKSLFSYLCAYMKLLYFVNIICTTCRIRAVIQTMQYNIHNISSTFRIFRIVDFLFFKEEIRYQHANFAPGKISRRIPPKNLKNS